MDKADTRELDAAGRLLLGPGTLAMLSCGVVFIEPAPVDFLLILFVPIALLLGRPAVHSRLTIPFITLAVFVATNLLSTLMAADPGATLRFLGITLYLVMACVALILVLTRHRAPLADHFIRAYAIGVGITTVVTLVAYLGLLPLHDLVARQGRVQGFFKDPNVFGAAVVPALVVGVARFTEQGRSRLLWLGMAGACAVAAVLSYSRGAWVNTTVCFVAFYFLRVLGGSGAKQSARTIVGFFVLMLALAPVAWKLTEIPAVQEMLEIRARYQHYDDNRFGTQLDAILAAIEHPLGLGPGLSETTFGRATHSLYVRALIENGLVSLFAVVGLLGASLVRATWVSLTAPNEETRVRMALIAGILWGLTAESFVIDTVHWRHFWIFLAFAWTPVGPAPQPR